jgi:hypothetical protein
LSDSSRGPSESCQTSELESQWRVSIVLENSIKARIKNVSQENRCSPDAFPLFSFLISLGELYEDGSSLNALQLRTEQLSWTKVDNRVLS